MIKYSFDKESMEGKSHVEVILDTLIDSIKLVPFLFLTYLAMEYLEHKAGEKTTHMVRKAGKMGPLIGGVAGVLPQCGFSQRHPIYMQAG